MRLCEIEASLSESALRDALAAAWSAEGLPEAPALLLSEWEPPGSAEPSPSPLSPLIAHASDLSDPVLMAKALEALGLGHSLFALSSPGALPSWATRWRAQTLRVDSFHQRLLAQIGLLLAEQPEGSERTARVGSLRQLIADLPDLSVSSQELTDSDFVTAMRDGLKAVLDEPSFEEPLRKLSELLRDRQAQASEDAPSAEAKALALWNREQGAFLDALPPEELYLPMSLTLVEGEISASALADRLIERLALQPLPVPLDLSDVAIIGEHHSARESLDKVPSRAISIITDGPRSWDIAQRCLKSGSAVWWVCFGEASASVQGRAHRRLQAGRSVELFSRLAKAYREQGLIMEDAGVSPETLFSAVRALSPASAAASVTHFWNWVSACANGKPQLGMAQRLRSCLSFRWARPVELPARAPKRLADIQGLDDQARQELSRLAAKLAAPKGFGAILYGPPGTGKTMTAHVLAHESGRAWIPSSYADWQACEHLGEHLSAMRESFARAIAEAPSVMFIDELDSLSARGSKRNSEYQNVVINAFLELSQKAIEAGVAIFGATNHLESIDPAVRRPGRLGAHVHLRYPSASGRAAILASLLPGLSNPRSMARATGSCSPARLAELADRAREIAAESAAAASDADLQQAIDEVVADRLRGIDYESLRFPVALGLCSKALAARLLDPHGRWRLQSVSSTPGMESDGFIDLDGFACFGGAAGAWNRLQLSMAALAARVARARQSEGIDALEALAQIDSLDRSEALSALAELSAAGLGARSGWPSPATDPNAFDPAIAASAWSAALRMADRMMPSIEPAARLLCERGELSGEQLWAALGMEPQPSIELPLLH